MQLIASHLNCLVTIGYFCALDVEQTTKCVVNKHPLNVFLNTPILTPQLIKQDICMQYNYIKIERFYHIRGLWACLKVCCVTFKSLTHRCELLSLYDNKDYIKHIFL